MMHRSMQLSEKNGKYQRNHTCICLQRSVIDGEILFTCLKKKKNCKFQVKNGGTDVFVLKNCKDQVLLINYSILVATSQQYIPVCIASLKCSLSWVYEFW